MKPINVTELVDRYRLILRDIWNRGIWCNPAARSGNNSDLFDSVELLHNCEPTLFKALIAHPLNSGIADFSQGRFSVVPTSHHQFEMQINMAEPSLRTSGHWYPYQLSCEPGGVTLSLVDFFEWYISKDIDLKHYLVRIDNFPQYPEHTNRHALIDADCVEVFFTPEHDA